MTAPSWSFRRGYFRNPLMWTLLFIASIFAYSIEYVVPFLKLGILETVRHETKSQTNFVRKMKRLTRWQLSPWKFKIDSQNRHISLTGDTFSISLSIYIYTHCIHWISRLCPAVGVAEFFMLFLLSWKRAKTNIQGNTFTSKNLPKLFENGALLYLVYHPGNLLDPQNGGVNEPLWQGCIGPQNGHFWGVRILRASVFFCGFVNHQRNQL